MNSLLAFVGLAAAHCIGAFCAWRAAQWARTPQGAVGWVVALLGIPFLAIPVFLVLGQPRFRGYLVAHRASDAAVAHVRRQRHAHGPDWRGDGPPDAVRAWERLAALPTVGGNACELLVDGEATFDAIFEAIRRAERYVLVQFYILRDDRIGSDLRALLAERAAAGVDVRVLYDEIGSNGLPAAYLHALREAGVDIRGFHSRRRPRHPFQINFRNHRKIVVADGEVGFVGGLNVGDEYMGRSERFGPWRDTHLALRGPATAQLQLAFVEDWHWATGEVPELNWTPKVHPENVAALALAPGPADDMPTGTLHFCNALASARRRIWIASPYFVPDSEVLAALKVAALRGVDVRILLPENRDHLIVWLARHAYFDEVREAGIAVHLHGPGFMHQKVMVVDDDIAAVGSINLDIRSCRLNFEAAAVLFDKEMTAQVAAMLERDFAASRLLETPLSEERAFVRYGAPVGRLFAPLL